MLRGISVLEVCPLFPGPFACQILRHHGAIVKRVVAKPKDLGDGGSKKKPANPLEKDNPLAVFDDGKEKLPLDLTQAADCQQLHDVLKNTDVLVQGHRPGSMDKYGLNPHTLRTKFPDLVVCCLSGYGLTGPLNLRAGHDLNYLARAGVLGMRKGMGSLGAEAGGAADNNNKKEVRTPLPVQLADVGSGTFPVVMHVLAAIVRKERLQKQKLMEEVQRLAPSSPKIAQQNQDAGDLGSDGFPGSGCVIDVSMTDHAHEFLVLSEAFKNASGGMYQVEDGNFMLGGAAPCYNCYPCKCGRYMAVGSLEAPYWKRALAAILRSGAGGFTEEEAKRFANPKVQMGMKDGDKTIERLRSIFLCKTQREWTVIFDSIDCMIDPVLTPDEAQESKHFEHRNKKKRELLELKGSSRAALIESSKMPEVQDLVKAGPLMPALDFLTGDQIRELAKKSQPRPSSSKL